MQNAIKFIKYEWQINKISASSANSGRPIINFAYFLAKFIYLRTCHLMSDVSWNNEVEIFRGLHRCRDLYLIISKLRIKWQHFLLNQQVEYHERAANVHQMCVENTKCVYNQVMCTWILFSSLPLCFSFSFGCHLKANYRHQAHQKKFSQDFIYLWQLFLKCFQMMVGQTAKWRFKVC